MNLPHRVIPGRARSIVARYGYSNGKEIAYREWLNHPREAQAQRRALATFPDAVARTAYYVALFHRLNHLKD